MKALMIFPMAVAMSGTATAAVVNYAATGYVNPSAPKGAGGAIFGTTTDIPGGGSAPNYTTVTNGAYVDFIMGDEDNSGAAAAHLRVTVSNFSGTFVSPGNFRMMLARTTNSQGLTDSGTISILFENLNSANITFSWFEPNGNFNTPLANEYTLTSYDIDFRQFNGIETSELDQVFVSTEALSGPGNDSRLDIRTVGDFTEAFDPTPGTNSTFSDVRNAVAFRTLTSSEQVLRVGKDDNTGAALFMFEFRNPPSNLPFDIIPEPSSSLMFGLAGLGFLARRRR